MPESVSFQWLTFQVPLFVACSRNINTVLVKKKAILYIYDAFDRFKACSLHLYMALKHTRLFFLLQPFSYQELSDFRAPGWLSQLNIPTLHPSLGHDLATCEIEPRPGLCADHGEPAWASLLLSLPLPCSHSLSLSLSK